MKKLLPHLTAAICLTILVALVYGTGQQVLRQSANDPQVQLAQDTAARLDAGDSPAEVMARFTKVDMVHSLAPFVIIYDTSGKPVAGSGYIGSDRPRVPVGVLRHAKPSRPNAVTWQPRPDIRVASVTAAAGNYYVLAGRSLAETENRTAMIGWMSLGGWLLLMIVLGGSYVASKSSRV